MVRDRQMVDRCLAGEVAAWEGLYAQCHSGLLVSIRILLGHGESDENLVDELAARVWYALVANDGELLARYDAAHGARLSTFLRAIAKDLVGRHFRTENRRIRREREAVIERPRHGEPAGDGGVESLTRFMATLSPQERAFCGDYLLARPSEEAVQAQRTYSAANIRQLSSRIQRKLVEFVGAEP